MSLTATTRTPELLLCQGLLAGDVAILKRQPAEQPVFAGLPGHLLTKQADLEDHRSRTLVLHERTPTNELMQAGTSSGYRRRRLPCDHLGHLRAAALRRHFSLPAPLDGCRALRSGN